MGSTRVDRLDDLGGGWVPAHLRDDPDDIAPPWPPDEVVSGVWQSGLPHPGERWDAVIDLDGSEPPLEGVELYVHWLIDDGPAPDLVTVRALADLVDDLRRDGKRVLVHCQAGINRSGLISAASLIRAGYTPDDAIAAVRASRAGALDNDEFVALLHDERLRRT